MHSPCSLDTCKFRYARVTLIPMIERLNNKRYSEEGKTNKGIITNVKIFMHSILKSIFPLNPENVINDNILKNKYPSTSANLFQFLTIALLRAQLS